MTSGLSGAIEAGESVDLAHLKVQIFDAGQRAVIAEAYPSALGSFEFHAVTNGIFDLRVVTLSNEVIHSTGISLPYANTVTIRLQRDLPAAPARPMSLARLQHRVPEKAVKEYLTARKAIEKGDRTKATAHLEKALAADPQFFEAANNLGVMYMQDKRLNEAFAMFRVATTIDSSDPLAGANLAYVLLQLHRYPEAEEAARASVRADGLSAKARFFLAISLLEQKKGRKEALFHLTKAGEQLEPAGKLLNQLRLEDLKAVK